MKRWDLQTGRMRLTRAAKQLRDDWQLAQEHWQDENARDFTTHHLEPLTPRISLLLAAVQRLAEVLDRAERECADEGEGS